MVLHNPTVDAFVKLGTFLGKFTQDAHSNTISEISQDPWFAKFQEVISSTRHHNGWFTEDNVMHALKSWSMALTPEKMNQWLSTYDLSQNEYKRVALILAGNIPLVGFHDLLAVLITGNTAVIKLSSNDTLLLPFLVEYLAHLDPDIDRKVFFTKDRLTDFDAVIATGSNNTARYFEYYFGKKPNIIRKNRNSIAMLNGKESHEELTALGEDIFRYYGLGCRSVSKLFVPNGYNFDNFFQAMYPFKEIINQHKYANNYDYNKAVYLMSAFKILDNGFLMLKKDPSYASPIATLFYEMYENGDDIKARIAADRDAIQCIVSKGFTGNELEFGTTQTPNLWDYADGVDTVEFLLKTSKN